MLRALWGNIKRLWDRYEQLDSLGTQFSTGLFSLLLPKAVFAVLTGLVAILAAAAYSIPYYMWILIGLSAAILSYHVQWIYENVKYKRHITKIISELPKSQQRKLIAQENSTTIKPTHIFSAILVGAIIVSVLGYVFLQIILANKSIERTELIAQVTRVTPPDPTKHIILGLDVTEINIGELPLVGEVTDKDFLYPTHLLTAEEEDKYFASLNARIPQAKNDTRVLSPHVSAWRTDQDDRFKADEWEEVLQGKKYIYLLRQFNYLVENKRKTTEMCSFIAIDYPSVHRCIGHNRTIDTPHS